KGLIERLIVNRHALKNALLPVVTLIGIEFAFLIGGLVGTEQGFNINGGGRLLVLAIPNAGYTLKQALVILTVASFLLAHLGVGFLCAWPDPRTRSAGRGLAPWPIARPSLWRPPLPRRRARVRCAAASSASAAVSRSARLAWSW